MRWAVVGVAVAALLSACASPASYARRSPADILAKVEVNDSEFDRAVPVAGPVVNILHPYPVFVDTVLRGWVAKDDGGQRHQLYAELDYRDHAYLNFDFANFVLGPPRKALRIYRFVRSCSGGSCDRQETVGVPLTRAELDAASETGLKVRLDSRGGVPIILEFPPSYVAAYLAAVDREVGKRAVAVGSRQ